MWGDNNSCRFKTWSFALLNRIILEASWNPGLFSLFICYVISSWFLYSASEDIVYFVPLSNSNIKWKKSPPPKKVKCTETQIWFDRQRLLLWFFKWGREIGNYAKRDKREKKGGWEGTSSQGRGWEVKESYDEYVCSMKCSRAINWSKLMPLTLESEGGMMIKQKNKMDKILKMPKINEKRN